MICATAATYAVATYTAAPATTWLALAAGIFAAAALATYATRNL